MTFYLPNHLAQCIGVINDCFKVDWEEAVIFRRRGQQGYKHEVWIGLNFGDCVIAFINININECVSLFLIFKFFFKLFYYGKTCGYSKSDTYRV